MDLLIISGTRPEFLKIWSLFDFLKGQDSIDWHWHETGQHPHLMEKIKVEFGEEPQSVGHVDLSLSWQEKVEVIVSQLNAKAWKPKQVLVQGDTLSALAGAKWAHQNSLRIIHLEAGMRSGNFADPYPEEEIRVQIAKWATYHWAVNEQAKQNLLHEGIAEESIEILPNPLQHAFEKFSEGKVLRSPKKVLVDLHRRRLEEEQSNAEEAVQIFFENLPKDFEVNWLGHPNQKNVPPHVHILPPMNYKEVLHCLKSCEFVLTDSGGLQLEALWAGASVGLLREKTEWPEFQENGGAILGLNGQSWLKFLKSSNFKVKERPFLEKPDWKLLWEKAQ